MVPLLVISTKVMMAIRISGIVLPPIVSAKTSLGLGHGTRRRHAHRHVGEQEAAEDEGVAEEEDPHHGLPPGDVLERPLVRGPVGGDALPARRPRGRFARVRQCSLRHAGFSYVSNWRQMSTKSSAQPVSSTKQDEPDEQQEMPVDGAQLDARGARCAIRAPRQRLGGRPAERHQAAEDVQPVQAGDQVEEAVGRIGRRRNSRRPSVPARPSAGRPGRRRRDAPPATRPSLTVSMSSRRAATQRALQRDAAQRPARRC